MIFRDPCECQAELGYIARIVEVSFGLSGMGVYYGVCVNVMLNLAIFCMDQCGKCVIFVV